MFTADSWAIWRRFWDESDDYERISVPWKKKNIVTNSIWLLRTEAKILFHGVMPTNFVLRFSRQARKRDHGNKVNHARPLNFKGKKYALFPWDLYNVLFGFRKDTAHLSDVSFSPVSWISNKEEFCRPNKNACKFANIRSRNTNARITIDIIISSFTQLLLDLIFFAWTCSLKEKPS